MMAGKKLEIHPQFTDLYPEYLFTHHSMIRASVPLMDLAQKRAQKIGNIYTAASLVGSQCYWI